MRDSQLVEFGKLVKNLRGELNLNQQELACLAGGNHFTQNDISSIENGKRVSKLNPESGKELLKTLGMDGMTLEINLLNYGLFEPPNQSKVYTKEDWNLKAKVDSWNVVKQFMDLPDQTLACAVEYINFLQGGKKINA